MKTIQKSNFSEKELYKRGTLQKRTLQKGNFTDRKVYRKGTLQKRDFSCRKFTLVGPKQNFIWCRQRLNTKYRQQ